MAAPAIVARGLTRRFGDLVAVDGIDLEIPVACIYGFLGPNGSGKSTTFRMLCGLLLPSAGDVRVLEHRVPAEAEIVRRRLGYMTQRFSLYDDLSVTENLAFIAEIYGLPRREARDRIAVALSEYRLEALARQRAGTMSGGQRQRLALAAATLHRPDLLLLDEPTSAVDPQSRRDFWESLFDLAAAGTTILVSTHYMDEAERCHRLAILDRGRIVAEGPPRELVRGIGAAVVEVQCDDTRAARHALESLPAVRSVTQLGSRLHALVDPRVAAQAEAVRAHLAGAGLGAQVEAAPASLEDVFVAATRMAGERSA
jgi:ABC-2 type transport system ATP-binding protein